MSTILDRLKVLRFGNKKREAVTSTPMCPKTAQLNETLGQLERFTGFSSEFKEAFVKQAQDLGMDRRGVYDSFALLDRGMVAQKRGEYIRWLESIHS